MVKKEARITLVLASKRIYPIPFECQCQYGIEMRFNLHLIGKKPTIPTESVSEDEFVEESSHDEAPESESEMDCENSEDDEVQLACGARPGSLHSKFAPNSVSLSMKMDPPEEKVQSPQTRTASQLKGTDIMSEFERK
ncbi:hypothetical protein [Parasitella parasitica]|uniref:Uncharacterized protein n=1 Tax=Parasitella parasitica TaxID=35722 RepID=A0A0B7NMK9_9FUNG|nr:hypothetical protein [Parasitella parasitica]